MTAPVFRPNFEKALKDVHDRVKILEAVPSGGTISTDAILFNNANTSLPSRGLVVVANDHNVSIPWPGGSFNRPGIALVSEDSYGMLLQATETAASIRTVADIIRNQITDPTGGTFLVETLAGTTLFEVDATGNIKIPFLSGSADLPWASGGILFRLGIGSTGDVLTVAAGVPTWAAPTGINFGANSGTSLTINVSSFALIQAGAATNFAIGSTDIANTLDSGATFTVYDSGGNPILRMTEGSPNLHIKTGGTVIADL